MTRLSIKPAFAAMPLSLTALAAGNDVTSRSSERDADLSANATDANGVGYGQAIKG